MSETVLTRREGPVLVLVNNNPTARNAVGPAFYREGRERIEAAAADPAVAAVVLTGAGDFFCAGGDLNRLRERLTQTPEDRRAGVERLHGLIRALRTCPKPVVAAVEGGAAGAGVSLALACDLVVAARGARFSVAYVKIGLSPDGGATAFLSQALPRQLVAELCLTGRSIDAERLHDFGLVNRLSAPGAALADAIETAQRLAEGPPAALARIKRLTEAAQDNDLDSQLDLEAEGIAESLGGAEAAEGIAAFLKKRPPRFPPG